MREGAPGASPFLSPGRASAFGLDAREKTFRLGRQSAEAYFKTSTLCLVQHGLARGRPHGAVVRTLEAWVEAGKMGPSPRCGQSEAGLPKTPGRGRQSVGLSPRPQPACKLGLPESPSRGGRP